MINVCISSSEHDSSICILNNEEVILYVQEERISKIKKDSSHPFASIKLIKEYTNIIDNLIFINCNFDHQYYLNFFLKEKIKVNDYHVEEDQHHLYHAASAFYGSGFEDAICLVIDGWGAQFNLGENLIGNETTSIYYAKYPANFELLYKNVYYNPDLMDETREFNLLEDEYKWDINTCLDIGVVYGTITKHIGFKREDTGKTMGLSSYGKEDNLVPNFNIRDTIYSDRNIFLSNRTINTKLFPELECDDADFQKKANISYKVQKYFEKVFTYRIEQALKLKPNCNNIVFSGGCALNILGNSLVKRQFPNINFYIDPVANDACQSYGAAKYFYYEDTNSTIKCPLTSVYHGPKYDLEYVKKLVKLEVLKYNLLKDNN